MAAQSEWSQARYAEVAVDAAVGPERTFTYAIPPGMHLLPGQPVLVPLLSRRVGGVVFALSDTSEIAGDTRRIGARSTRRPCSRRTRLSSRDGLAARPAAHCTRPPPSCFRRTSDAALCGTSACLPRRSCRRLIAGGRTPSKLRAACWSCCDAGDACRRRRCNARWGGPRCGRCDGWCGLGLWPSGGSCRGRRLGRPSTNTCGSPCTVDEAQRAAGDFPLSSRRLALLQQVLLEETLDAAQARKEFGADTVRRLVDRGLLAIEAQRRVRDPLADYEQVAEPRLMLTAEQADAVGHIANSVRSGQAGAFLLHGPTGSGKTEVYLRALAACVAVGKRGMLLAPEISLTPQLVARLQSRFPGRVGLLHSGLTAGQHYDTWWRVREGDYDVVLGTRSAVFAPMPDLGLIILDEEHEWTYKQAEMAPRYHARSTAMTLGPADGRDGGARQRDAGHCHLLRRGTGAARAAGAA